MGMLDSVAGIMGVFAVNYIDNAAMIVLLQQAAIPISMSISKVFLGARYTICQVRAGLGIGKSLHRKTKKGHAVIVHTLAPRFFKSVIRLITLCLAPMLLLMQTTTPCG